MNREERGHGYVELLFGPLDGAIVHVPSPFPPQVHMARAEAPTGSMMFWSNMDPAEPCASEAVYERTARSSKRGMTLYRFAGVRR